MSEVDYLKASPKKDSFTFRGHDMKTEFGIWMVKSDPLIPSQRKQFLTIPLRDGSYEFPGEYYDDRTISVRCDTRNGLTREQLRYLAKLFSLKSRIVFWDEPDKYYIGKIYDDKGFNDVNRFIREFTLNFLCEPFAYGRTQTKALPSRFTETNAYLGTARTPTHLEIKNTGTTTITQIQIRIRRRSPYPDPTTPMTPIKKK